MNLKSSMNLGWMAEFGTLARALQGALVLALALGAGSVANAVPIISMAGGGSCQLGASLGGGACTLQEITPHRRWQGNNPLGAGAAWVAYDDTGWNGTVVAPFAGSAQNPTGQSVIMSVFENFSLGILGGSLSLSVGADDTAGVWLDGVSLFSPTFTQNNLTACASGPIGCEVGAQQEFFEALGGGDHVIRIDAYQVGFAETNNPFGVLYSGDIIDNGDGLNGELVDVAPMPEPSAALLFACGAVVLRWGVGQRRQAV